MNILKQIILTGFIFTAIISCDKVDKPYIEDFGKCGNGNLSIPIRKILLEDYTGHTCGNCPRAAEQTELLLENYCDHIIPISVHVGFFAKPFPSDKYSYDFRTKAGDLYNYFFRNDVAGLPNGMVNRVAYNGTKVLSYDSWASAIDILLQEVPTVAISVNNSYNTDSKEYFSEIKIDFLKSHQTKLNLTVLIVEDSILNWQKDYEFIDPEDPQNKDIEDYMHRHVLRDAISNPWGEEIVSSSIEQGESLSRAFSYILHESWVPGRCSIVAFISNSETREVLQAEMEGLTN